MEIPIQDLKGKELGTVILTDEVDKVLKDTGLSVMFDYDPKEDHVIAYLH